MAVPKKKLRREHRPEYLHSFIDPFKLRTEPLSWDDIQWYVYQSCDCCLNLEDFVELTEWCAAYSKRTLTLLYEHCLRNNYETFAQYIIYHY